MKNKRGLIFLTGALLLFLACIVKEKVFDNPQKCRKKVSAYLNEAEINTLETNLFNNNKTYIYRIYFLSFIPLGELKFKTEVNDLGDTFSFEATTQKSFIEKFMTAQAGVNSYCSKKSHLPYKYTEITQVKGKIKTKTIIFDQAHLMTIRGDKKFKIPQETYDPVSAFVKMLTFPLKEGNGDQVKFVSGEDVYLLKSKVMKVSDGIAKVLIDMRRENLTSSHGATFTVWITNDTTRVPLVFKCFSPAGYVSVVLDRAE